MNNLELQNSHTIKQTIFLSLCLLIPYLHFSGYRDESQYLYFAYIAYVFFEADHYNIRFIVVMVALETMFSLLTRSVFMASTRIVFEIEDFTVELILLYLFPGLVALALCFAILHRGRLVSLFRKKFKAGRRYRLIGMEWLLFISFFSIFLLHIIFTSFALPSMIAVTGFDSYFAWYELPSTIKYLKYYENTYLMISIFLMFSIQSYNYKRCRKEWVLKS